MPERKLYKTSSGLYLPQATFPGLEALIGTNQIEGISPQAIPVILIADVAGTSTPLATGSSAATVSAGSVSPLPVASPVPPKVGGTTLWFHSASNINTPTHYTITCPNGWAWQIEEIVMHYTCNASPRTDAGLIQVMMTPSYPVGNVGGPGLGSLLAWWANGHDNPVAGDFYNIYRHGMVPSDDLSRAWDDISAAARTAKDLRAIPDFLITEGGQLNVRVNGGGGANQDIDNFYMRTVVSWFRV